MSSGRFITVTLFIFAVAVHIPSAVRGESLSSMAKTAQEQMSDSSEARLAAADKGPTNSRVAAQPIPSFTGVPSETALVTGLADFLANRAKDEAVQSFLGDLTKALRNNATAQCLLPKSQVALADASHMGYRDLVPALAAAFSTDLENLPDHVVDPACPEVASRLRLDPGEKFGLVLGIRLFGDLRRGRSPAIAMSDLFDRLASTPDSDSMITLHAALAVAATLAMDYTRDPRRTRSILDDPAKSSEYLDRVEASLSKAFACAECESMFVRLKARPELALGFIRAIDAIQSRLDAGTPTDGSAESAKKTSSRPTTDDVLQAAESSISLIVAIIPETSHRAASIKRFADIFHRARTMESAIAEKQWPTVLGLLLGMMPASEDPSFITNTRLIVLASNLAAARDADGVRTALETGAEPVGGFRYKRGGMGNLRRLNCTINGYVGPSFGREVAHSSQNWGRDGGNVIGLTGLLGLEGTFATHCASISSISVFGSLLDLGNVIAYRARGKEDLSTSPEVGFKQVMSPGVFAVFGITKDRPISLGLGYSIASSLRIDSAGEKVDVHRLAVFLAMDLVLFKA